MNLIDQNKQLMLLLQDLIKEDKEEYIKLIEILLEDKHPSLQFGYKIMTKIYNESKNKKTA